MSDKIERRKWGPDKNLKFIKLYKQYSCLWDPSNEKYRHKRYREAAFQNLVSTMGLKDLCVEGAKAKVRSLRGTYIQRKKSGVPITKFSLPWLQIADSFLPTAVVRSDTKLDGDGDFEKDSELKPENGDSKEFDVDLNYDDLLNDNEDYLFDEDSSSVVVKQEPKCHDSFSDGETYDDLTKIKKDNYKKRKKRKVKEDLTEHDLDEYKKNLLDAKNAADTISSILVNSFTKGPSFDLLRNQEDEFDMFANSIVGQMRKLPAKKSIELRLEIQNLISTRKLKLFQQSGTLEGDDL